MQEIQTIQINREEMEGLGEDFLLRMLRPLAMRADGERVIACAVFLPPLSRGVITDLILARDGGGLEEIRSQARDGGGVFRGTMPTAEEQEREGEIERVIRERMDSQGGFQSDITHEMGKDLTITEIESVILVCVARGWMDMARESANSLPLRKRFQALAILS